MTDRERIKALEDRELELMREVICLQRDIIALKNQQKEWPDAFKPIQSVLQPQMTIPGPCVS